jgi:N-acetylglutamate synthase-like GNAT family acetyltransferase
VTTSSIDSQILSTLELLHYCRRFQNTIFGFIFEEHSHCEQLVMDLRVLQAAGIQQVIFCPDDDELVSTLETWNRSGDRFVVIEAAAAEIATDEFARRIKNELSRGGAPFIALQDVPSKPEELMALESQIADFMISLGCKKIFFPSEERGLLIDGSFKSYPTIEQVEQAIQSNASFNIAPERVRFLVDLQQRHGIDIVLAQARRGSVFEEVFTHAGSGTLFTEDYPNILRPASESDVREIMAIMQPYVAEGALKPVTEEELLKVIRSFMVYSVNGQIVCAAALIPYGNSCEIGKLCTLPRFQARGRARALVQALVEEARKQGRDSVFALTVQQYVGDFFEKLGFDSVQRENLPEEWRKGYDFSRPSRAYQLKLGSLLSRC